MEILFLIFAILAFIFAVEVWLVEIINIHQIQKLNLRLCLVFILSALITLYMLILGN